MSPKEISAKRGKPFQLVRAAGSGVSNPFGTAGIGLTRKPLNLIMKGR
jgi:hypothetical protein